MAVAETMIKKGPQNTPKDYNRCSMENTVQRRLNSLFRHFRLHETLDSSLHQNYLSGEQQKPLYLNVEPAPVIIGVMVLDIHAKPYTTANPGTTTPGEVQYVRGGVARNVAECMSKLGVKPFMISVVGLDMAGDLLLKHWKSLGLPTEGIRKCHDTVTPVVSNIFDVNGEVAAGVASIEAVEKSLTPEWIWQFRRNIWSAPVLMVDANLHPNALEAACRLAAESSIPVWFEPVSVEKSKRIATFINHIKFTSPNENELVSMANALSYGDPFNPIQRVDKEGVKHPIEVLFQMLKPAILLLLEKGIEVVVVTLGSDGVFLCFREASNFTEGIPKSTGSSFVGMKLFELVASNYPSNRFVGAVKSGRRRLHPYVLHLPALSASVTSLTGAGDCLVGGTLASMCAGLDIARGMAVGIAVAKAAVETETNVPSEFCTMTIADDAKVTFCAAKEIYASSQ